LAPSGERGVGDFGDLGVGDPPLLVLVPDRVRVADRGPGVLADPADRRATPLVIRAVTENRAPWRRAAAITSWPQNAESARRITNPLAPRTLRGDQGVGDQSQTSPIVPAQKGIRVL
jgi:hypothetical protein